MAVRIEEIDDKIPLLRSEEVLSQEVFRLLQLAKIPCKNVFSTVSLEQEYFLVDKTLYSLRPDLVLASRTVFGAKPAKGQELEEPYFGAGKERISSYMKEFEERAAALKIFLKTRQSGAAYSQFKAAPVFEKAPLAVDHNTVLMGIIRQEAEKENLVALFHEKPFAYVNGSGKYVNWSIRTDEGENLFDLKGNSFLFLTLLTALIRAVFEHADLFRAAIGSAGNDHRLKGADAPFSTLSIYLGQSLEKVLEAMIHERKIDGKKLQEIDFDIDRISIYETDPWDRNWTSFLAFTGEGFEFRSLGACQNAGFFLTVINAIVADSLKLIIDEILHQIKDKELGQEALLGAAVPVLRKHLILSEGVLFNGNSDSFNSQEEAKKRGLSSIQKSFHAYHALLDKKTVRAMEKIFSEKELESRFELLVERYAKQMKVEVNLMIDLFRTQILPAALEDQRRRAEAVVALEAAKAAYPSKQKEALEQLSFLIESAIGAINEMEKLQGQTGDFGWEAKAKVYAEIIAPKMEEARGWVDALETVVDNALWPLPKYWELLHDL